jgi:hypothetical protein
MNDILSFPPLRESAEWVSQVQPIFDYHQKFCGATRILLYNRLTNVKNRRRKQIPSNNRTELHQAMYKVIEHPRDRTHSAALSAKKL